MRCLINAKYHDSILIHTGLDRTFIGFWIVRAVGRRNCTYVDLAVHLRLSMAELVGLAMCKSPRKESWDEDINHVAQHFTMDPVKLRDLIEER